MDNNHEIITVLNKSDLPASEPDKVKKQIEDVIGVDTENAILASGKTGEGINEILESIIKNLPSPKGRQDENLKALLVDSWYDSYLGVVILVRVINGKIKKKDQIIMMSNNSKHEVERVGIFTPKPVDIEKLDLEKLDLL